MNYIAEAEEILKNHKKLNDSKRILENRKKLILKIVTPKELRAIDYERPAIQHMDYSNDTINEICELAQVNQQIKETEAELKTVNEILETIKKDDEISEKFIQLKFFEKPKVPLRKISSDLGYSEESNHTIYDIKNRALKEFAILYFGARAQKNI